MSEKSNKENEEKTEEMLQYEKETGKRAIWHGVLTESFKKWKSGEKIYIRDKERIALYVSEELKKKMQDFVNKDESLSISKLIREAVKFYIDFKEKSPSIQTFSELSHELKDPLTIIKGFIQIILDKYKDELSEDIFQKLKTVFEKSLVLENKIVTFLDKKEVDVSAYDILIVEDDISTYQLLEDYFEIEGLSCKGLTTGSKVVEEVERNKPKLILLDIILPDINGYDICKILKSNEELKNIPVYFITAVPAEEVEKKIKETMVDGYLLKPFDFSEFDVLRKYF